MNRFLPLVLICALFSSLKATSQSCPPFGGVVYDKDFDMIITTYHSHIARSQDGFVAWGEDMAATGANASFMTPITPANGYNYTGTPLMFAVSGNVDAQAFLLTTTGLYSWGSTLEVVGGSIDNSIGFNQITMPAGVTPADVADIKANSDVVFIRTTAGGLWVAGQNVTNVSGNAIETANTWIQVEMAPGFPLTGVVDFSGCREAVYAILNDGTIWTWGNGVALGNGTATSIRTYAAPVSKVGIPTGVTLSHIGVFFSNIANSAGCLVLGSNGKVYGIGNNSNGQIITSGTGFVSSWTTVKDASNNDLTNIVFLSTSENSENYATAAVIQTTVGNNRILTWGWADLDNIGHGTGVVIANPTNPSGYNVATNNATYISVGGHATSYFGSQNGGVICFVGHISDGSGAGLQTIPASFQCFNNASPGWPAGITLCGAALPPVVVNYLADPDIHVGFVNSTLNGNVSTNDDGLPAASLYSNPAANPSNPSTSLPTINSNGTYSFTSTVAGVYTFNVPILLPNNVTIYSALQITVVNPNADNDPVANTDQATTAFSTSVILNTLSNDQAGNPNSPLVPGSVTTTTAPSNGTTSVNVSTGSITYTPTAGFTGLDTLYYRVLDADGDTAFAMQIIEVLESGAANVTEASDDYQTTAYNTAVSGAALLNDHDPEGNTQATLPQTITVSQGSFVMNALGTYTFTPAQGFSGAVSFPYTVVDNNATPDTTMATVYITVLPPTPSADPDVNAGFVNSSLSGNLNTNDDGIPTGSVYSNPATNPANPSASLPTINNDGTYSFTSAVAGVYTFNVPILLPNNVTIYSAIQITVLDPNADNDPVANTDQATTLLNTSIILNTLGNDQAGNPNSPLVPGSVVVSTAPSNGTTSVNLSTGSITYTPTTGFTGMDTLYYRVLDADGDTAFAMQVIQVLSSGVANVTEAADDYKTTAYNTAVSGAALLNDNDPEGDIQATLPQTITVPQGTFVMNALGTYTFTPAQGFSGAVNFPYTVFDNDTTPDTSMATVYITVLPPVPVNDPDANTGFVNSTLTGNVGTNDDGLPGGAVYSTPAANPANPGAGLPAINANGTYSFSNTVPGVYTFIVPVALPNLDTLYSELRITVFDPGAENNPVANTDQGTTTLNTSITLHTLSNDQAGNPNSPLVAGSVTVITAPSNGTTSVNLSTGSITYTPNAGFTGLDTLYYRVLDADGDTATAMQVIQVLPAGASNVTEAADDYKTTAYNKPVSGSALLNDHDPEGDAQSTLPQTIIGPQGIFVINALGTYTFTPAQGFSGAVNFPYTIVDNDASPDTTMATIYITVLPPAPVADPDINTGFVNSTLNGNVNTNDDGLPGGAIYSTPAANPANPSAALPTMNANGTYSFTSMVPGVYTFNVPVILPNHDTIYSELRITVFDPGKENNPVANTDQGTTTLNTSITLNTLSNDQAGNPNSPLVPSSVAISDAPSNGSTNVNLSTGSITYTPNAGFTGLDTLYYRVLDADGDTAIAMQIIQVLPSGASNVTEAADDYKTTTYNKPVSGSALLNDYDPEGDTQSTLPQTITVPQGIFVMDALGTYTFTPAQGFSGPVNFPYTVVDNDATPDTTMATVYLTVLPPAPVADPDINAGLVNSTLNGNVSTNDDGLPNGTIYANPAANPANPGTGLPTINNDGTYSFMSGVAGVYTFQVPVVLPNHDTTYSVLQITVLNPSSDNDPVANTDHGTTTLNTSIILNTLSNDQAGNPNSPLVPGSVAVSTSPSNGTTSVNLLTGAITYTPNAGFTGLDTLYYRVLDTDGDTAIAMQVIDVLPAGAANVTEAADDYKITAYNTAVSGAALLNDHDPEGDTQSTLAQTIVVPQGTFVIDAFGTYTFTPNPDFMGAISFPYTVLDNDATPDTTKATVYITVLPQVAGADPDPDLNITLVNMMVIGDVSTNDAHIATGSTYGSPVAVAGNPSASMPSLSPDGTYSFSSTLPGVYRFLVPLCDTDLVVPNCPQQLLTINVIDPVDTTSPPIANTDIGTTILNTPIILKSVANDGSGNPSNSLLPTSVSIIRTPTNGLATVNASNGEITYVPNTGFTGIDTLEYSVCDDQVPAVCATALQIINVEPINAPNSTVAADDYKSTTVSAPVSGSVALNDFDPQANTIEFTKGQDPANGSVIFNTDGSYTYTPLPGFIGTDQFTYSNCDNGTPIACKTATVYFAVFNNIQQVFPITLENFTVIESDCKATLHWVTSQEHNVLNFEIQRRVNSGSFVKIGTIKAIGNSQVLNNYHFNDANRIEGIHEYRLKINDVDGRSELSDIVSVNISCKQNDIRLYPNPASSSVNLAITALENVQFDIKMINMLGHLVYRNSVKLDHESKTIQIPLNEMALGTYTIVVSNEDEKHVLQFIKYKE